MIRKPDADSGSSAHQICACPSSAGQQEKEKRKKGGEFGKLSEALFHTITRMRSLIMTVAGMKNEVLQSGECVMETSGKVNEMVESAGYTMEAFGNMSSVMESNWMRYREKWMR